MANIFSIYCFESKDSIKKKPSGASCINELWKSLDWNHFMNKVQGKTSEAKVGGFTDKNMKIFIEGNVCLL